MTREDLLKEGFTHTGTFWGIPVILGESPKDGVDYDVAPNGGSYWVLGLALWIHEQIHLVGYWLAVLLRVDYSPRYHFKNMEKL